MNWYIFKESDKKEFAWLEFKSPPQITNELWKLKRGKSMADVWPQIPPMWKLDNEKGDILGDYIGNYDNIKVVSSRFKDFLENNVSASFEFYPINIEVSKDSEETIQYWIVHLIDAIACLDKDRSDFVLESLSRKEQVDYFRRIILDENKIPADQQIFRLDEKLDLWIIKEDLVDTIFDVQGFQGQGAQLLRNHGSQFRNPYNYKPDNEAGY